MKIYTTLLIMGACILGAGEVRAQLAPLSDPYYVPMKYSERAVPVFPQKALNVGLLEGQAAIAVQIDADGKLSDYVVVAYSHPAFAESAIDAIKQWRFTPAYIRGDAVSTTADLSFSFKSSGAAVVETTIFTVPDLVRFRMAPNSAAYRVASLSQLDRIPTPTKIVKPGYTPEQAHLKKMGHVTVQFYIDDTGHVRMPAVSAQTSEENEELSAAAVGAVGQWEFEPPTVKGLPVTVLAEQDFDYQPPQR